MDDKVKVLLQIEIPRLNEDVDIASIRKILNEYVKSLIPRINIQDLKDWSLLIWVACRSTNGIGVFKRARRYPSDKEFEFSISVTIPDDNQVSYGLSKVKEAFYTPLSDKSFYSLEFNFEDYNIIRNGFKSPTELFCMEWTPRKGFYFVTYAGEVKRGEEEVSVDDSSHVV